LENLARDGEIMMKCNLKTRVRDEADRIHLVQDSEKRQAFVITVMNTLVSINVGIS
jgi:hypothetical protein